jgi:hypothetical protein
MTAISSLRISARASLFSSSDEVARVVKKQLVLPIDRHVDHLHHIARRRTLPPELTALPRPKVCFARLHGLVEALPIHERDHQHPPTGGILNHRGDEASFVELERTFA